MFYKVAFFLLMTCSVFSQVQLKLISDSLPILARYEKDEIIITLEDQSVWSLKKMQAKRSRSFGEWWSSKTPVEWELEDDYFCDPKKWPKTITISVYQASKTPFQGFDFILENEINHEKVFAKLMPQTQAMIPKLEYASRFFSHPYNTLSKLTVREESSESFIGLEDLSLWRIFHVGYNWRSLWQWMNSEEIDQPDDCFVFDLSDWSILDEIQVYKISEADFENKYTKSQAKIHSYLLENVSRNQYAYASPIRFQELIDSYKQRIQDSYDKGYSSGYDSGYNRGYSEGYKSGKSSSENTNSTN